MLFYILLEKQRKLQIFITPKKFLKEKDSLQKTHQSFAFILKIWTTGHSSLVNFEKLKIFLQSDEKALLRFIARGILNTLNDKLRECQLSLIKPRLAPTVIGHTGNTGLYSFQLQVQ